MPTYQISAQCAYAINLYKQVKKAHDTAERRRNELFAFVRKLTDEEFFIYVEETSLADAREAHPPESKTAEPDAQEFSLLAGSPEYDVTGAGSPEHDAGSLE